MKRQDLWLLLLPRDHEGTQLKDIGENCSVEGWRKILVLNYANYLIILGNSLL